MLLVVRSVFVFAIAASSSRTTSAANPMAFITNGGGGQDYISGILLLAILLSLIVFGWLIWGKLSIKTIYVPLLVGALSIWITQPSESAGVNFISGLAFGLPLGYLLLMIFEFCFNVELFKMLDSALGTDAQNVEKIANEVIDKSDKKSDKVTNTFNVSNPKKIIRCPFCSSQLRIPALKNVIVKCRRCAKEFQHDGTEKNNFAKKMEVFEAIKSTTALKRRFGGLTSAQIQHLENPILAVDYLKKYKVSKDVLAKACALNKIKSAWDEDVLWVSDIPLQFNFF